MQFEEEMRKNAVLPTPICMHIAWKESKATFPQCQKGIWTNQLMLLYGEEMALC